MYLRFLLPILVSVLLCACGGGGGPTLPIPTDNTPHQSKPSKVVSFNFQYPIAIKNNIYKITGQDKQTAVDGNFKNYKDNNVKHKLTFSIDGKDYVAKFDSTRTADIHLYYKNKTEIKMSEELSGFNKDGREYIKKYFEALSEQHKNVTPILDVYEKNIESQKRYLANKRGTFRTYIQAFKDGKIDHLIIPFHIHSVNEDYDESNFHISHIMSGVLSKDINNNINLTIIDTGRFQLQTTHSYKQCLEHNFDDIKMRIATVNALLNNTDITASPTIHDYNIDGYGLIKKDGAGNNTINTIKFRMDKQFGNRGCAMTTLQNIGKLLSNRVNIEGLSTISRNDFQVDGKKDMYTVTLPGMQPTLNKTLEEAKGFQRNTPDATYESTGQALTYKFKSSGEVSGNIVNEAITRIMLFIKFGE